ncbi:Uncharacterized protein Rs2_25212 [Raphanus sativus]|nr:Uncharacterized protein Rs2_25209 [Raphanus sativus]KAJ4898418.1 Uncharacterized protein Rs2_25212 [Raphanus sativus]
MADQAIAVPRMEPLSPGEAFLRNVARDLAALYRSDGLLKVQAILSILALIVFSLLTQNPSSFSVLPMTEGTITLGLYAGVLLVIFFMTELNKDLIWVLRRVVRVRYHIILFCLRAAGIILVLRAFVYVGNNIEKVYDINGFAIAAFLCGYLHIVSMCKLMNVPDVLSFADALLAVAVMISAKLELATKFTNPVRICSTYLAMVVLVMFRNAKVPFEKVSFAESKGLPPPTYRFAMVNGCTHALVVVSTKSQTLRLR